MNRKADYLVKDAVVYLVLLLLFLMPVAIFVWSQMNGAGIWADFYAKEISRVVNLAEPGDVIRVDVHKATEIALDNEVSFSEVFSFDNVNNEVCVKLSRGRKSCYGYFNDIDVVDWKVNPGLGEPAVNTLTFQIKEVAKA